LIFYEAWWLENYGVSMGRHDEMEERRWLGKLGKKPQFITCVTVNDWWEGQKKLNKLLLWNGDNCPGVNRVE
jgi:hypothetical protein